MLLPGLSGAGTGAGTGAAEPAARLLRLGERYFEAGLQLNPIEGSYALGDARFEDKLAIDIAPRALARDRALQRWLLRELARLPEASLGEQDRLSLALLRHQARTRLATLAFPEALLPLDQSGGLPVLLAQFAGGESVQPFRTVRNYENFLRRLSRLPAWNRQAVLNMRRGLSQGISMPQPLVERCLESLQPLLEPEPTEHPFYQPLKQLPAGFSPAQRRRLAQQYQREIRQHLQPSLRALADFLREEYLPRARTTAGLSALPGGAAWYAQAIRLHTSSGLDAEAIHQLGLAEVARIRAEMSEIQRHYGHTGELSDFLLSHPQRPEFRPFQSEQEVLDAYAALNRLIEARLPALFHRRPKASLEIVAAPELGRASASDHYLAPAADGSRPGAFVAVIMDPRAYSSTGMATLLLHEGQPGHHYHLAPAAGTAPAQVPQVLCADRLSRRAGPCMRRPWAMSWACSRIRMPALAISATSCCGPCAWSSTPACMPGVGAASKACVTSRTCRAIASWKRAAPPSAIWPTPARPWATR